MHDEQFEYLNPKTQCLGDFDLGRKEQRGCFRWVGRHVTKPGVVGPGRRQLHGLFSNPPIEHPHTLNTSDFSFHTCLLVWTSGLLHHSSTFLQPILLPCINLDVSLQVPANGGSSP